MKIALITDAWQPQVNGVVMVLKAGVTNRDVAKRTLRALQDVKATMLGAVLNDVNLERSRYGDDTAWITASCKRVSRRPLIPSRFMMALRASFAASRRLLAEILMCCRLCLTNTSGKMTDTA